MKMFQKGFTLIELSIVLVIISLMVVGVLGAKHMIDAAELTSVATDIRAFSAATDSFEGRYGALPGDLDDISILPYITPETLDGNGNARLDTEREELQFWVHLGASGLLAGNFDGTSAFVPATNGVTGGIPAGKIAQSGYTVKSDPELGLMITFARFTGSTEDNDVLLPVLTPAEAASLDIKFDDGNPYTGSIRAIDEKGAEEDGAEEEKEKCRENNAYAASGDNPACILQFIIRKNALAAAAAQAITCDGSAIGTSRVSTTSTCPVGYTGNVIESCMAENGEGIWVNIQRLCRIMTCGNGSVVGDEREISCPDGYEGSITQTCQTTGIWGEAVYDCGLPLTVGACSEDEIRHFPCPLGQSGVLTQQCTSGEWKNLSNTNDCIKKTCSGTEIGRAGGSSSCPGGYNSGDVQNACTLEGEEWAVANTCTPSYGGGCGSGQTRNITCPPGSLGEHWQKCNQAGYWETDNSPEKGNSCVPANCGGYPVGTVRPATYIECDPGTTGLVVEMCTADGSWEISKKNCNQMQCEAASDDDTQTNWQEADAGTASVLASSCQSGSTYPGQAARDCTVNGTWGAIRGGCVPNCPAGGAGNAVWEETQAGETANINEGDNVCIEGYVAGGEVQRECLSNGDGWGDITGQCFEGVTIQETDFW